jgi:hypothetical protein
MPVRLQQPQNAANLLNALTRFMHAAVDFLLIRKLIRGPLHLFARDPPDSIGKDFVFLQAERHAGLFKSDLPAAR